MASETQADQKAAPSYNALGISISQFAASLLTYRWIVLSVMLSSVFVAGAFAFLPDRMYEASITVIPADIERGLDGVSNLDQSYASLASLAGINLQPSGSARIEAIAVLSSRAFTAEFIRDKDLLPVLFSQQIDAESGEWLTAESVPSMDDALEFFHGDVRSIREDSRSGLVTLTVRWRDPTVAADWANTLIDRVNERMRQRDIDEGEKTVEFLLQELERTNILEIRQSIYRLVEAQIRDNSLANVRSEYSFRVVDPAMAPDIENFVFPRPAVTLALGFLVGIVLSLVVVFLLTTVRRNTRE